MDDQEVAEDPFVQDIKDKPDLAAVEMRRALDEILRLRAELNSLRAYVDHLPAQALRLECLKLAHDKGNDMRTPLRFALQDAEIMVAFVLDGTVPEAKQPTHAPSGARIGQLQPAATSNDPLGR